MIEIKQIRAAETWVLRHKVMWAEKPFEFVVLPDDALGFHYGLFDNGRLVSVISMFINGEQAQFRKFATDTAFQGKGYGTQLLNFLIERAKSLGVKELCCDARVKVTGFYQRFGMEVDSDVFQKRGNDYVRMRLKL